MIFQNKRKISVTLLLLCLVAAGISAFRPTDKQPRKRNLKVLPENISHDSLDHLMDAYKVDLGVKCGYCHAQSKDNPRRMDASSDDNPKKDIARNMIRMTNEMNQKYISLLPHSDTGAVAVVTCNTCHRGEAKPTVK